MKSANIMTLFSEQPRPFTGPSAFIVSIVLHCVVALLFFLGLNHAPRVNNESAERFEVRILKTPQVEAELPRPAKSIQAASTTLQSMAHNISPGGGPPAPSVPTQLPQLPTRSQILVQPDVPQDRLLQQETPVPLVVMWSAENSPSKTIVAPPQQEPTVAMTRPALIKPNREPKISDLNITMTPFPTRTPIIPPGSTTPIVVRGREQVEQIPSTSSQQLEPPTPARVLSISPLQSQGPVVIPMANQAPQSGSSTLVIASAPDKASGSGGGNPASKQSGIGAGDGSGSPKGTRAAGDGSGSSKGTSATGGSSGSQNGIAAAGLGTGSTSGSGAGNQSAMTHITLPKDGQFGVVIVGSSLADQYPEIVEIWSSRLVYTVYLHVGLGKNWILQYSLPRSEEAATLGNAVRPEAPWPYDILRPHLAPEDYNADAIIVHGFINLAGRFDHLALVFPSGFAQAKFVLNALEQWQFRPARQNGQIAAVEVLLIIPEETE